ncbi:MAG: hypothetical protein MRY83_15235 [Flavobacteriales bacterium]|nr:hypothetical protein [Flavobacteriales bacterium]
MERVIDEILRSKVLEISYYDYNNSIEAADNNQFYQFKKINSANTSFLLGNGDPLENSDYISVYLGAEILRIQVLKKSRDLNILEVYVKLFKQILSVLSPMFLIDLGSQVSIIEPDYPKIRPERDYAVLSAWGIIDFLSKTLLSKFNSKVSYQSLSMRELPTTAKRINFNSDIYIINWANQITNTKELMVAFMKREEWLYKNLNFEIEYNYNSYGDKMLYNLSSLTKTQGDSFFTYYKERIGAVYKVLPKSDGRIDKYTVTGIRKYKNKGKLNSGVQIKKIVLILPSRSSAVAISELAQEIGVYKVLYTDKHDNIWDMNPVGNWNEITHNKV